jgi:hypothetical protein
MAKSRTCRQCGIKGIDEKDFSPTKFYKGKMYYRAVCKSCYDPKATPVNKGEGGIVVDAVESDEHEYVIDDFAKALISLSRHSLDRLRLITQKEFESKTKARKFMAKTEGCSFSGAKALAEQMLIDMGYAHPLEAEYDEGLYLIVGDSHGKHTKRPMFKLLNSLNKTFKFDRVIHLGHMVDDDDDVSYLWDSFDNLTILAKPEELQTVHRYAQTGLDKDVVRGTIRLGDLNVINQELVSDYVRTSLKSVDASIFPGKTVCNLHRPERSPRCSSNGINYIAAPGCLCEPHIVKCIKQIDFNNGFQTKMVYPDTFIKYRRAAQLSKVWDQGILMVKVDSHGVAHILQCAVQDMNGDKVTAVFDRIFCNDKVTKPDLKVFTVGDTHCPDFDIHTLDVQNQIAERFQGDVLMDLGDATSMTGINHHTMGRREIQSYANASLVKEASLAHWILKQRTQFSDYKECVLLFANHERFSTDFIKKNPQFSELLNIRTLLNTDDAGYTLVPHKVPHKIGPFTFVHGDMDLYGESGKVADKLSRAFDISQGKALVYGHVHSAGIRSRTYSVGMGGVMDQMYNETAATYWTQGCGLCTAYRGLAFVQLIDCIEGRSWYGDKILSGLTPSIKFPTSGKFSIKYEFEG